MHTSQWEKIGPKTLKKKNKDREKELLHLDNPSQSTERKAPNSFKRDSIN